MWENRNVLSGKPISLTLSLKEKKYYGFIKVHRKEVKSAFRFICWNTKQRNQTTFGVVLWDINYEYWNKG